MLCVCLQEVEIIIYFQSLIGNNKTVLCRSLVIILLLLVPVRNMYGFTVNVSYCVYQRFGKCRVGMNCVRYILGFHMHSNCKCSLPNHLACMWCDNQGSDNYSVILKNLE